MSVEITREEHKERHVMLHGYLDELVADWCSRTRSYPSTDTVLSLMRWSHAQTMSPTDDENPGCVPITHIEDKKCPFCEAELHEHIGDYESPFGVTVKEVRHYECKMCSHTYLPGREESRIDLQERVLMSEKIKQLTKDLDRKKNELCVEQSGYRVETKTI